MSQKYFHVKYFSSVLPHLHAPQPNPRPHPYPHLKFLIDILRRASGMAIGRQLLKLRISNSINLAGIASWRSHFSSRARIGASPVNETSSLSGYLRGGGGGGNDLGNSLLKLVFPRRSAAAVLQNWVNEGRRVSVPELRRITRQLLKRRRIHHTLEILAWMEAEHRSQMTAADRAVRLELIIKLHSLVEAEKYYENLPDAISQKAACLPLLHAYVKEMATEKAEALMLKINSSGLAVTPHPFNEMMKLYMATSQPEKVLSVIRLMKQNQIPRNVLSYNLWMRACGDISGVDSAETVYEEMMNDKNVDVGWSSLCTLANIYQKLGLIDKAVLALRHAEDKLSAHNRLGYFFLITIYTALKNKDEVLRLWEASKAVEGKITCANYMSILLCLVKLGDIKEAEKIFIQWESQCRTYDIRVSNILLGAYVRNELMGKAESLHLRTLERGGRPNYKTWEILMEGWVRCQNLGKAFDALKKGFAMLKECGWRPSPSILLALAEYFEKTGNFEDAREHFRIIRGLGLASLPVYKSLLRMHINAKRPVEDILQLMEKDGIRMDDEIHT